MMITEDSVYHGGFYKSISHISAPLPQGQNVAYNLVREAGLEFDSDYIL